MNGISRKNCLVNGDLPSGLCAALSQNTKAMAYFSGLSETQRQSVITESGAFRSRRELQDYVDRLTQSG